MVGNGKFYYRNNLDANHAMSDSLDDRQDDVAATTGAESVFRGAAVNSNPRIPQ